MNKNELHDSHLKFLATEVDIHKTRRGSIGSTDTSVILGLNPFKTIYQLWLEKTGKVEPEDISSKWPVRIGLASEDMIAKLYAEDYGSIVKNPHSSFEMHKRPWITSTPDRLVSRPSLWEPEHQSEIGLEIKTGKLTKKWGESGSSDIPDNYYIQCMQCMMTTGLMEWHLAAELYGNTIEVRYYHIKYNDEVAEMIINAVESFWFDNVIGDTQPEERTVVDLQRIISEEGSKKTANDEILNDLKSMTEMKSKKKIIEEEINRLEGNIKIYLDSNEILVNTDGDKVATYKSSEFNTFDSKRLKEDNPNIYDEYIKKSIRRSLRGYV